MSILDVLVTFGDKSDTEIPHLKRQKHWVVTMRLDAIGTHSTVLGS